MLSSVLGISVDLSLDLGGHGGPVAGSEKQIIYVLVLFEEINCCLPGHPPAGLGDLGVGGHEHEGHGEEGEDKAGEVHCCLEEVLRGTDDALGQAVAFYSTLGDQM